MGVPVELLRRVPLLSTVDDAELADLAGRFCERGFDRGSPVVSRGSSGAPVAGSNGSPVVKPSAGSASSQAIGWRYGSRPARSTGGSRPGPLAMPMSSPW